MSFGPLDPHAPGAADAGTANCKGIKVHVHWNRYATPGGGYSEMVIHDAKGSELINIPPLRKVAW